MPQTPSSLPWKAHLGVLGSYLLLATLATYPLVLRMDSACLGWPGDSLYLRWNMWFLRHSLVERHIFPLAYDIIYPPFSTPYLHTSHVCLWGMIYTIGSFLNDNVFLWTNLLTLASFGVCAWGTFLLAYRLTQDAWASALAGCAFSFSSGRILSAFGHLNLFGMDPIPFFLLFAIRGLEERRRVFFVGMALAAGAALWHDYYQGLFVLMFSVCLVPFAILLAVKSPGFSRSAARAAAPGLAVALALILPLCWEVYRTVSTFGIAPLTWETQMSASLSGYLLPSAFRQPFGGIIGAWRQRLGHGGFKDLTPFVGFTTALLVLYGVRRLGAGARWRRFFMVAGLVFLLFSYGPGKSFPRPGGKRFTVPLPYALVMRVKPLADFRAPFRLGHMVVLCASVLAACGLADLRRLLGSRRRLRGGLSGAAIALVLFEHWHAPIRAIFDGRDPGVIPRELTDRIAADPRQTTVLNYPFYAEDFRALWLQLFHHKPILTGVHSRPPRALSVYDAAINVGGWFDPPIRKEDLEADPIRHPEPSLCGFQEWLSAKSAAEWTPETAGQFCHFFQIGHILLPNEFPGPLSARLRKDLLPITSTFQTEWGWLGVVEPPKATFPLVIQPGLLVHNMFFTENFGLPDKGERAMTGRQAEIVFRLDQPDALSFVMRWRSPMGNDALLVDFNGYPAWSGPLSPGVSQVFCRAPAKCSAAGYNRLRISVPEQIVKRPLGGLEMPVPRPCLQSVTIDRADPHREWLQKPPDWMDEDLRGRFERLYAIHDETGLSLADLAVRFLLADPDFSTVIPGPSTVGQLEENIQSANAGPLPPDLHARLDALGRVFAGVHGVDY